MDAHPQFRVLHSSGKMMTCYIRHTDKFLKYHTLCTSILKCAFPTKGIKLTQFVLLEVPQCLSFEVPRARPFRQVTHQNLQKTREAIRTEILLCLIKLVRLRMRSQHRVFPFSRWSLEGFRRIQRGWKDSENLLFREDERIQRDLQQFPTRSSCIRK